MNQQMTRETEKGIRAQAEKLMMNPKNLTPEALAWARKWSAPVLCSAECREAA